jgi:hypothetical protein
MARKTCQEDGSNEVVWDTSGRGYESFVRVNIVLNLAALDGKIADEGVEAQVLFHGRGDEVGLDSFLLEIGWDVVGTKVDEERGVHRSLA